MTHGGTVAEGRAAGESAFLTLTGEFQLLSGGRRLAITHMAERVLAYLALAARPVNRMRLAGSLWLDASDRRSASNLRTALWRLHQSGVGLVSAHDTRLLLAPAVRVDVTELTNIARRFIDNPSTTTPANLARLVDCGDLLPDWDDEWVVTDRERFRLIRLQALETCAAELLNRGNLGEALLAAEAATHTEPLRESTRRLVVRVHLAHGNIADAIRSFQQYRALLKEEFGLEPSRAMFKLIEAVADGRVTSQ
jgi:DNA-binding SARP family transcriptional activator